ncbi:WbqC family protein [Flavobacterium sp. 102]|uniref:WbqC family protein n=1 Tax=Flavobacterium sp. 102 TaxID=2135623 RepID=UPI000EB2CC4A|nr:WbqC family protein [Flavobacterium sp. 102]RKS01894.1 WbqC-like protein [Flavobacterium sp. 102]
MKAAIMQPYFFPYIGYFQLLNAVDTFVVYDDVNFIKKGWVNRNNILLNNKQYLFTIALKSASQNKLINQIELDDNSNWKTALLKTIHLAYGKATFFEQVFPLIQDIIEQQETNLSKLIVYSLQQISSYLSIPTTIIISSDIEKDNSLKGQDKIIEICKKLGATNYINAVGGMTLYEENVFLGNNIVLQFIKSDSIVYPQFKNAFIPHLSIIDVMMFNAPEQIKCFLEQYELI